MNIIGTGYVGLVTGVCFAEFVITSIEAAELIKYAANSFLAMKVSFMNEMANLCEALGVDVHVLAKAVGLDQRIGSKNVYEPERVKRLGFEYQGVGRG